MILYRPVDSDAHTAKITYRPRTCFLMTQLGGQVPEEVDQIRCDLKRILGTWDIKLIDANTEITGKDFLLKIWNMIVAVPLAIAVVHKDMPTTTQCNIFYEIGVAQTLGKETIVIKTEGTRVPSDFVRTEYIEYDEAFKEKIEKYLAYLAKQADYYENMADQLENNPLLSIDYLRRAYLISGNENLRKRVSEISSSLSLGKRARNSVEMLLSNF